MGVLLPAESCMNSTREEDGMSSEMRRRTRIRAEYKVSLRVGEKDIPVTTRDLSLKGLSCLPVEGVEEGMECGVRISLADDINIQAAGTIVRVDEVGVAVDFTSIEEESFFHLRRLVELNYGDGDKIDEELHTPAFKV